MEAGGPVFVYWRSRIVEDGNSIGSYAKSLATCCHIFPVGGKLNLVDPAGLCSAQHSVVEFRGGLEYAKGVQSQSLCYLQGDAARWGGGRTAVCVAIQQKVCEKYHCNKRNLYFLRCFSLLRNQSIWHDMHDVENCASPVANGSG